MLHIRGCGPVAEYATICKQHLGGCADRICFLGGVAFFIAPKDKPPKKIHVCIPGDLQRQAHQKAHAGPPPDGRRAGCRVGNAPALLAPSPAPPTYPPPLRCVNQRGMSTQHGVVWLGHGGWCHGGVTAG
eukprot:TRINITY_DN9363_c0_g1_i1.p2 TRINITY_DN9363_c0_g1~~TRINITY_DN9363_c0_g1_i1.p2  ORF type:complete len:130 (+),score=1.73 TRINITY_DN9363_c0_g1_i1:164-553(+)